MADATGIAAHSSRSASRASTFARLAASAGRWLTAHDGIAAFVIYLAATVCWDRAALAHMGSVCACGVTNDPGDAADFVWSFVWFPHALLHGLPMLHTTAMWTPTGINLAGTTASLFLAFAVAPITWLWGPIVSFNVVMIVAPLSACWCAYRLCRYISGSPWASMIAGATYGFSTFEVAQAVGHPQMIIAVCPPLAVLSVLRFLDGRSSKRRFVIELTLLTLVQMFVSTEVLFTATVLGAVALGFAWCLGTRGQRQAIVGALPLIGIAYALTLVASSWYVREVLAAPAYAANTGLYWPTDALSYVVPSPFTWILGHAFTHVNTLFAGGPTETDSYLGVPLLTIVIGFLWTRRERRVARLLAFMLIVSVFWVLGTQLHVTGRATLRLPYSLIEPLPGFNEVFQGRIALYVSLLCAIVLALWMASPGRHLRLRWTFGVIALAFVLPNFVHPSAQNTGVWANPTFFRTDMYKRYLSKGETILPIVWGYTGESPMWQAEDHMYYNLASGYWLFEPPAGWESRLTADLWLNTPRPGDGPLLRALLKQRHVSDVVVQQDQVGLWGATLRDAGLHPTATVGGVRVYHVPRLV
jgi:hypothetical protein